MLCSIGVKRVVERSTLEEGTIYMELRQREFTSLTFSMGVHGKQIQKEAQAQFVGDNSPSCSSQGRMSTVFVSEMSPRTTVR